MASSSTLCPVSPSQLCSSNNELYSPSQALVRTHMVWKKDKKRIRRVRCTCMATSAIPDMGKRQLMNMLLLGAAICLPTAGKTLEINQPQYTSCRNLLRSGPAASLRINIRAVAQYASDSGNGKIAGQSVDQCLSLLETVPSDVLAKGKAIADAYRVPEEDIAPENLDPEMKQLESIL